MIEWPDELIEMIARRRCVVFVGSGISSNSIAANGQRPPTWGTFLSEAVEQCPPPRKHIKNYLKAGDYLSACDIIKGKMEDNWNPFLRSKFVDPGFDPVDIHHNIFSLDARIYITPNFDKIFDRHAMEASGGTISIKSYSEDDVANIARGRGRYILKIHGDIDNPQKLIFTRSQYAAARAKYPSVYRVVEALLVTNCFLFLGCGLNDPDLNLLLEEYRFSHNHAAGHYVVLPRFVHADTVKLLRESRNLKVLQYDKRDSHSMLKKSIEALAGLVETKRAMIRRNADW